MTSTSAPSLIRVVSFNVRYDTSRDGEDAWPRRKNDVIRFLSEQRPTIFGLQEPLKHQVAEIAEGLGAEYARYGVGRDDGKNRGEFNPIFYDKTVLEIIDSGVFWLSETPDDPGTKFRSSSLPRIVTWGRFIIRESSRSFYFFNTHFDHRGQEARLESAVLISRRILELCDMGPAVLIGDFNEERPSDVFSYNRVKNRTPVHSRYCKANGKRFTRHVHGIQRKN